MLLGQKSEILPYRAVEQLLNPEPIAGFAEFAGGSSSDSRLQILHLEDNPDDAEIVRLSLVDRGYDFELKRVQTRLDFLAALQQGGWSLILADYALPSFGGLSALQMAIELCPDVPLIVVTGAMGEECAVEALTAGATDYVLKGRTSRLVPAVDRALKEVAQRRSTRAAEEALKQRDEQYRILFETNPVGLVYSSMTDGGIAMHLQANTAYLNLVGYSRSEFLSGEVPWTELTPLEYRHLDRTAIAEALATGASTPYEKECFRKNGERVWVRTRNLIVNRYNDHFHVLTHMEDITGSRQAKEQLRIAEQSFRALFDEAPVAYHEVDQDGRVVRVNQAECELLGVAASEILGRPISEFVVPSQTQRTRGSLTGAPPDGSIALPIDCTFHDRNGMDRIFQLQERRITDAAGAVIGHRAAMLDVTEAKRATRKIEFQANLLADVNEAIVATDTEFRIIYWNAGAERMFGWCAGEAIGQKYSAVSRNVSTDAERESIHKKILASGISDLELNCVNRQGDPILVLVSLSIIRGQNGDADTVIGIHRDITEQRRTDERLRVLSTAVEQCPVSIVITNLHGDIEYVNPKASELTGYTLDELKGKNPSILKSGETAPEEYRSLWKTIPRGTWQGILHNKKKNGELFWESATICPIRDGQGLPTHFLAVKEDITERKAIQEALQASEERFRVAAESTNDLIYEWDLISGIAQIFGPGDKIVPASGPYEHDSFMRMIHPEDRVNVDQAVERHLQTGERFRQEYRVILPDGSTRYLLDQGRSVRDAAGRPVRWIGATTDITDRKVAGKALAESEERFRLITETISEVFWMTDQELTRMIYVSPAYERAWGRPRQTLYDDPRSFLDAVHPQDMKAMADYLQDKVSRGQNLNHEYRIVGPDGSSRWIWNRGFPVCRSDGSVRQYVGVAMDITERKQLELQLTQAQKLESIGQLAAGIAHEINTPIQYIGDNATFLQDAFADLTKAVAAGHSPSSATAEGETGPDADMDYLGTEIPKAIQELQSGVAQVARIVRAMKTFSHPGQVERTSVDLNAAIESTIVVSRNEWKYVADVTKDLAADLPLVPCLAGEVNQVILNLIINAAHAISDVVKISGKKGAIKVSTRRNGDWAEIRIADTGSGIPEAIHSKVFDLFFTTKEAGKGTGQGLAIAHAVIVQKHHGTLSFNSEIGVGTTFTVQLPLE